ncbi:MAG: GNAT family N-acetyltransferase [Pseudomonadota bacterium]
MVIPVPTRLIRPTPETAPRIAGLAALVLPTPHAWTAEAFERLGEGQAYCVTDRAWRFGLLVLRIAADEAEVLSIGVAPEARRQGLGGALLATAIEAAAGDGATQVFLEVAEGNRPARALYAAAGFTEAGRRPAYYRTPLGREDALLLVRAI